MNVGTFLDTTTKTLKNAGIATARLDCLVLLEDVLGMDRASLLAHPELSLASSQIDTLNNFITQRAAHTPLAYIRGQVPFFGRDFIVNTNVLVPRPETEVLVEMLLHTHLPVKPRIADIGTGSGCLGITAALEVPNADVTLYDIDAKALDVATQNAKALAAKVHTAQADLLSGITGPVDVIVANLPYVPNGYPINRAAAHEPVLALFAGDDGLDLYCRLWQEVTALDHQPTHIFTESLPQQHEQLAQLAHAAGYVTAGKEGFIQHFTP